MRRRRNSPENLVRARAAAFRIWDELDHPHPKEISLESLAAYRDVFVHYSNLQGAEGRLIRKGGNGIINAALHQGYPRRTRFTVAHELGHWELHQQVSQFICDEEDMRDYGRSPMEAEANHFAAELLMPTFRFRDACGKALPSMQLIEELSNDFETTLTSTAIRFADVSRARVVVVWFYRGIVKWSYSNPEHSLPFVMPNRPVPENCSATLRIEEISNQLDHYELANWFPQLSGYSEVLEVTKRMPNLDAGLTLLYFP